MKGDTLKASGLLDCAICRTDAQNSDLKLYSDYIAHVHCRQCGYEIILVAFRFEKTNFGIHLQTKIIGEEASYYDQLTYASPHQYIKIHLRNKNGEVLFLIKGDQ